MSWGFVLFCGQSQSWCKPVLIFAGLQSCAPSSLLRSLARGLAAHTSIALQKPALVFLHAGPQELQGGGDGPTSCACRGLEVL